MLALNAAIEAARAGEQGRGFAVVADEVRKLAERTSKATKEIADMIKNIQVETKSAVAAMQEGTKQVEMGVESTTMAGSSLSEIIQMADRVGEMVTHIATAATEQSSATEEVNNNIEQISKITSETAAGAQQSAKAVHELSNLALDLQNLVSQFKLSHNGSKQKSHGRPSGRTGNALALRERSRNMRKSASTRQTRLGFSIVKSHGLIQPVVYRFLKMRSPQTWINQEREAAKLNKSEQVATSGELLQLVSFHLGGEEFGLEILKVQEIIRMQDLTRVPNSPDFVEGVINLRGKVIPVVGFAQTFQNGASRTG